MSEFLFYNSFFKANKKILKLITQKMYKKERKSTLETFTTNIA